MAKLSIIVPSYNHAQFLKDRLDSIQAQTFKDWELIIIDDCSTDGSLEILENFANRNKDRIKHFIVNENNLGSGYTSWQKGIQLATTEYIWIAETDDYSKSTFLEETIRILEMEDKISFAFCSSNYVDVDKNFLYNSANRTKKLDVAEGDFKIFDSTIFLEKMPISTYITNGSSVVFRKPITKVPVEIFSYKQSSDQFLWTYLIQNKSFAFLNKNLNYFRRHENSTTERLGDTHLKDVYLEKAAYLNYFKLKTNTNTFLKQYISYYVWNNKRAIFDTSVIVKLNNVRFVKFKYFTLLFQLIMVKFNSKLWK